MRHSIHRLIVYCGMRFLGFMEACKARTCVCGLNRTFAKSKQGPCGHLKGTLRRGADCWPMLDGNAPWIHVSALKNRHRLICKVLDVGKALQPWLAWHTLPLWVSGVLVQAFLAAAETGIVKVR